MPEPYVQADPTVPDHPYPFRALVPTGTVLVAGDLRNNSNDSRVHSDNGHLGAIPRSRVDGVVAGTAPCSRSGRSHRPPRSPTPAFPAPRRKTTKTAAATPAR
ncbi:S26 family signal peptidase [Amycolatopsis sp. lyj-23]|uniref:S26 family signal peptidase n=1 Tax=Amycolatopsis sp. lyj-23 TaxID=2789283 RepID=UPI00397A9321